MIDRPYVITNFAITLDGRATLHGRSGAIGSDADTEMLVGLRTKVDAVMIGAGTMRAERYGRVVPDPEKRARRERDGLPHDPLAVIVSGRLDIPWDAPLFTDGGGRVLIFTASETEAPETQTPVQVVRHQGDVDLAAALTLSANRARRPRSALRGGAAGARPADRVGPGRRAVRHPRAEARRGRGADPGGGPARARATPRARLAPRAGRASSSPATAPCAERFRRRGSGRRPRPAPRRGAACGAPGSCPPSVAARPQLSWTLSTPSRVQ